MMSLRGLFLALLLAGGLGGFFALVRLVAAPGTAPETENALVDAPDSTEAAEDPPEVAIGERLFRETRFAQFFFANSGDDVNARLAAGDPVVGRTVTTTADLPGGLVGDAISCRACHLVGEHAAGPARSRAYADFAPRSPIPARDDGRTTTVRNSPTSVDVAAARATLTLHFDGEFASAAELAKETLLGRNYGWLPAERAQAIRHIARVVREDAGTGELAREFGGSYRRVLLGARELPASLRLPVTQRIDVMHATDEEILGAVGRLIGAYLESLAFERDSAGAFAASPYDRFLEKNRLPRAPDAGEAEADYGRRLLARVDSLASPVWVEPKERAFRLHDQPFAFGPRELQGLRVFLRREGPDAQAAGVGNCVACHVPPRFTDGRFHNTGASESEYDAVHGAGAFAKLRIPSLRARNADFNRWLPATPRHPRARGPFRDVPDSARPGHADLGVWNVVGNPDLPGPQDALTALLSRPGMAEPTATLVSRAVGCFKTPGLRDLGHSEPYLHTGRAHTLEDVLAHYLEFSVRARTRRMRNPDPELARIHIAGADLQALAAFLRSLNEDYE